VSVRTRGLAILALAPLLLSCGAGIAHAPIAAPNLPPVPVRGSVAFEARAPTSMGASAACELRPARFVTIAAVDGEGNTLAQGHTDASGLFAMDVPSTTVFLEVRATSRARGLDIGVTRDAGGDRPHVVQLALAEQTMPIDVVARDVEGSLAGALHLLDTMERGLDAVRTWTGRSLPPLYAYWDRGVTTEWSYYRGERPEGSGRFCVELLGGDPGAQDTTDTDEHDEAIVLHELGHFVMDRLTGDSSLGGQHPRGYLIDPGLAWEEGRATWFATAVLGAPPYRDTIGIEPRGRLRVDESLETPQAPRGIGSETSVAGVLWDLSDGEGTGLPDTDADGIALGPARVLTAMIELAGTEGAFPSLPTFLRHLVATGRIADGELRAMLASTGEPEAVLPAGDVAPWPRDLPIDGVVSGKIDGLSQPAPSGGANRPDTGFDAVHAFRVRVARRGMIAARIEIEGSGAIADHTDLDLELRDARARVLEAARGTSRSEAVARIVEPGWYVVYVRDGGSGNRADYQLRVTLSPI
jgi:hypothetical protein